MAGILLSTLRMKNVMSVVTGWLLLGCAATPSAPGGHLPADATRVVVTRTGGFSPNPQGSTCTALDETYTLDLASHQLSFKICTSTSGGPNMFVTGQPVLGEADFTSITDALDGFRATAQLCSGDLHDTITIVATSGDATSENAQCLGGESDLLSRLEELAH